MVKNSLMSMLLVLLLLANVDASPLVAHGDGTVTDQGTGLMWQQADDNIGRTWQAALDYCNGLELPTGGYADWRLPDKKELESIIDYSTLDPAINVAFTGTKSYHYWSSTSVSKYPERAWFVFFYEGYVNFGHKEASDDLYVRCVR